MSNLRFSEPVTIEMNVVTRRFFEDAVHDGDVDYHQDDIETVFVTIGEAIDLIRNLGLTWQEPWFDEPDGSRIIDFATGEREECSVHFEDNEDTYVIRAIIAGVETV